MLSQDELDKLLDGGTDAGGGDDGTMSQDDLDSLFGGAGGGEQGSDDDATMSQEELDALMNGGGGGDDEADSQDDANMSQEELDALMGGGGDESSGDESMDQGDLDALFGGGTQDDGGGGDATMDQGDLDALFGGGGETDAQGGEDEEGDIDWSAAFAEAAAGGDSAAAEAIETGQVDLEEEEEEYEEEEEAPVQPFIPDDLDIPHLHFILELPLELTVEIGKTIMNVRTILQLTQGSVIELSKDADEPVEIYVGKKLMAKGEVVVVEDNFGVRIDEILSQADRIRSLSSE